MIVEHSVLPYFTVVIAPEDLFQDMAVDRQLIAEFIQTTHGMLIERLIGFRIGHAQQQVYYC